jgi:aminoglycoside 6'-N-acetyltransferase
MWIIELDDRSAGMIQSYWHKDYPDHDGAVGLDGAVGIDYFLATEFAGRGLGSIVIRGFTSLVFERYPTAVWCAATPAQANRPSWRALELAGFERLRACQPPDEPPAYLYAVRRRDASGTRSPASAS